MKWKADENDIIPSTELFDRQYYEVYGPEWNPDNRA